MVLAPTKICSQCKLSYPATLDYYDKQSSIKSGLRPECKKCRQISSKAYHIAHKKRICDRVKVYSAAHKKELADYRKRYSDTIMGRLRKTFSDMNTRCSSPNHNRYHRYGGRGIQVKFKSFDEFVNHVVNELQVDPRGLTVDRIDNNGHYESGNIRFVTNKMNCQNRG